MWTNHLIKRKSSFDSQFLKFLTSFTSLRIMLSCPSAKLTQCLAHSNYYHWRRGVCALGMSQHFRETEEISRRGPSHDTDPPYTGYDPRSQTYCFELWSWNSSTLTLLTVSDKCRMGESSFLVESAQVYFTNEPTFPAYWKAHRLHPTASKEHWPCRTRQAMKRLVSFRRTQNWRESQSDKPQGVADLGKTK